MTVLWRLKSAFYDALQHGLPRRKKAFSVIY